MFDQVLNSAKAIAAFVGAALTAVVALNPSNVPTWVAPLLAVLTAIATYAIPNAKAIDSPAAADDAAAADPGVV